MTASKPTMGERMVKIETNLENLDKNLSTLANRVTSSIESIEGKLDTILKEQENVRLQYVTRGEHDSELQGIKEAIENTKKRHGVTVWISSVLAIIFSSVVTLLLTFYFTNMGR